MRRAALVREEIASHSGDAGAAGGGTARASGISVAAAVAMMQMKPARAETRRAGGEKRGGLGRFDIDTGGALRLVRRVEETEKVKESVILPPPPNNV